MSHWIEDPGVSNVYCWSNLNRIIMWPLVFILYIYYTTCKDILYCELYMYKKSEQLNETFRFQYNGKLVL